MTQMDIALAQRAAADSAVESSPTFLDTVTLASMLAPFSQTEFVSRYWEKRPLVIHRNNPGYYGNLFTLEDYDESIMRAPEYIKMADATVKKQVRHHGSAAHAREKVLADMRGGATLILDSVQQYNPNLGLLCRKLSQELNCQFQTNLYLTPPNGQGFLPHWDGHDVFVMQMVGSKNWKIEKVRRTIPEKGSDTPDSEREFRGEVMSFTLKQGDLIYIPRGYIHAAECGSEESLHVTLGIHPVMLQEFLGSVIKAAGLRELDVRMSMPLSFIGSGTEEIVARAGAALRGMQDPAFLEAALKQYRREWVQKFPLDISGQVVAHFHPVTLSLTDQIRPRPGTVWAIDETEDAITVYVGTRTVTFPHFFKEALEFALNTSSYAIRNLPGDLEDEERLLFVERLMQEGLVVH